MEVVSLITETLTLDTLDLPVEPGGPKWSNILNGPAGIGDSWQNPMISLCDEKKKTKKEALLL